MGYIHGHMENKKKKQWIFSTSMLTFVVFYIQVQLHVFKLKFIGFISINIKHKHYLDQFWYDWNISVVDFV